MVTVKDTGMGIPESELDSIFEKFRQVKENIKNIKGNMGTGLGLYIVKSIVEMHGGKVWVDSKAGEGSEFHFIIGKEK
jgi:signal transduction histidine kinase